MNPYIPVRRGHYTYREVLAYLEESQGLSLAQLYAARRSCLRSKIAGEITAEQCLNEAHLINLAIHVKEFARDGES